MFQAYRDTEEIFRPCLQGARLAIAEHAIDALRACILIESGVSDAWFLYLNILRCGSLVGAERR